MTRETVRDGNGRTIGYKMKNGSQTIVQDAKGNLKGRYDENTGKTLDSHGRVKFQGDHTDILLGEESE